MPQDKMPPRPHSRKYPSVFSFGTNGAEYNIKTQPRGSFDQLINRALFLVRILSLTGFISFALLA
ncbi:hypothetical protein ALC57_11599 [Trachymyrmex cornetzi]|uniref:Uncharacterized protein n=1 Tax=Trachymyrmex cornetzi TaxID=471704 RepID=A0A151J294_9HYME|nr:hypothetical protein ALC57_11599 [Trachymyrmex cornetzi]